MIDTVAHRVASYLELNRLELLENWRAKVIIEPNDPYEDTIILNGASMLTLVISYVLMKNVDEEKLQYLAQKVSLERVNANINIGAFVYNVNIARSEIFDHLPNMGLSIHELHPIVNKINSCFDKFLYFAVEHYTDIKNQKLNEQSSFIEQTHKDHLTILGQMSSSFVHEFRNPLTSVMGFVQLLREKYPALEYIDVMTKELNQLGFRINQFLLVSKKGSFQKEKTHFHIAQIMDETLDFLYPMILSSEVLVEKDIESSIYINGYPDEFRQVLINILMNSLDALSYREHKMLSIKAKIVGEKSIIELTNNGPVIPSRIISTIFEPFVSTKKLGTGIGLYVCRKIVHEHNGSIECESNDEWTTFRISVPLAMPQTE